MGNYVRYTDDQIEQANSVPIAEVLDAQGEQYKRHGAGGRSAFARRLWA